MAKKEINLLARLNSLVERVKNDMDENLLVFLDTGAVIDFEREISRQRRVDKEVTPSLFYNALLKELPHMFVSEGTLKEVDNHYKYHCLNGLPEISIETRDMVRNMYSNYCNFLKHVEDIRKDAEQVRFDIYWASKFAFPEGHKKAILDPISRTDREMVSDAAWSRYAIMPGGEIGGGVIISPDSHIAETIKVLTGKSMEAREKHGEFGYGEIKVIPSR
jgi:hypothetical protein